MTVAIEKEKAFPAKRMIRPHIGQVTWVVSVANAVRLYPLKYPVEVVAHMKSDVERLKVFYRYEVQHERLVDTHQRKVPQRAFIGHAELLHHAT